jgi:ABC-2 type transport system permease protein
MTTATITVGRPAASRRPPLALVLHQIRYEQLSFWRNPQSAIFTFVSPVVFIVLMGALFGGATRSSYYDGLSVLGYYLPTIAALSVIGSCYGQLAMVLASRRQNGILKRVRAAPLPAWAYFTGLLVHCVLISLVDIVLIVAVGSAYGAALPSHWLLVVVILILGAASFCALGVGVASMIANADAAPVVSQFVLFPLLFLSGTYTPIHSRLLNEVVGFFPVRPFNQALIGAFSGSGGLSWQDLGVLLAWGGLGAVLAIRRFRWNPRPE